jgi:glutamine synthetase
LHLRDAKQKSNVSFLVGFETEFILLKSTDPITAVNPHGWSESEALYSGSVELKVLEDITKALERSGVEVLMYHAEAAPGQVSSRFVRCFAHEPKFFNEQYELITGPLPPLQAADALVHTRETIYNIANKHGLRATLAPRVYTTSCTSLVSSPL